MINHYNKFILAWFHNLSKKHIFFIRLSYNRRITAFLLYNKKICRITGQKRLVLVSFPVRICLFPEIQKSQTAVHGFSYKILQR